MYDIFISALKIMLKFLDTVTSRVQGSAHPRLSTKIKKTDKGLFYHFASFIPYIYKLNFVSTLVYRIYKIASNMIIFDTDVDLLEKRLKLNGFPKYLIDNCIGKVLDRYHVNTTSSDNITTVPKREIVIALPCLGPLSNIIRRRILSLVHKFYPSVNIRVVFRRGFRIANLFNYKDRFPIACRSMIVYHIHCRKCGPSQAYIGKTVNTLYERFHASGSGHLHPHNVESALLNHINKSTDPDCEFHFEDVKILETGRYDQEIRFMESIFIEIWQT